jgi:hypothetical protein
MATDGFPNRFLRIDLVGRNVRNRTDEFLTCPHGSGWQAKDELL